MKHLWLAAAVCLLSASGAHAAWSVQARVRFETGDGYKPWTNANVKFATGAELNRATNSLNYNSSGGRYVVIPMTGGAFNVVQLAGSADCGPTFTQDCLPTGRADGFDPPGRHWQICTNPKCDY